MRFKKSAISIGILAIALLLHGVAFFLAVHGLHLPRFEQIPPPPLSMSVQVIVAPEPEPALPPAAETPPVPAEVSRPAPNPAASTETRQPSTPAKAMAGNTVQDTTTEIAQDAANVPASAPKSRTPPPVAPVPKRQIAIARPPQPVQAADTRVKTGVSIPAKYETGNRAPAYPRLSIQYGEQGIVSLRVFVNADETAGDVEIKKSSGHPRLDQAAVDAVTTWRFEPARIDGIPVGEWYPVDIPFKLLH